MSIERNKSYLYTVITDVSVVGPSSSPMVGMRRTGESEGVRHVGNIRQTSSTKDLASIRGRVVVKDMDHAALR